jgi:tRNA threonylcarbamoyladenosine biosynthesis protein TsaB
MNILALDTCFDACSAAAGRGLRSLTPAIAFAFEPMQVGHAERLMPMIETVMDEAGLSYAALDRIAVTIGPGTFTGTRISVSAARALSLATGAPVVPVTSLRLMAMSPRIPAGRSKRIAIATDARRGEVYVEVFDRHSMRTVLPSSLLPLGEAAHRIGIEPVMVAGSGAASLATALRLIGGSVEVVAADLLPDAVDMLFETTEWPAAASVSPLYLRAPDAKPPPPSPISGAGA